MISIKKFRKEKRDLKDKEHICFFEQLFENYFKRLNIYAVSYVHDREIARDITHDAFMTLWKKRQLLDYTQSFYPYLACLVRNRCINHLNHQRIEDNYFQKIKHDEIHYELFDDQNDEQLVNQIIAEMNKLPQRCQEVMRKCFLENKKYKEVAEELGISTNTVKEHVSNGLKILRRECSYLLLFYLFKKRQNN